MELLAALAILALFAGTHAFAYFRGAAQERNHPDVHARIEGKILEAKADVVASALNVQAALDKAKQDILNKAKDQIDALEALVKDRE